MSADLISPSSYTAHQHQKNVLVTGATGLLGAHLAEQLVQQNYNVYALYRSFIPANNWAQKVKWIQADILDVIALEQALKNIQQVYHCAAVVSFSPKKKQQLFKTNIEGTANIVNACINNKVEKLVYASSVSALGRPKKIDKITEQLKWTEATSGSAYGKSKYLAEMEVWRGIGEGLDAAIVNPVIILGAADWNKGSSEIFHSMYKEFPWYTEGINGFVDVLDVVQAMVLLMNSNVSAQRFILSAANISYKDLFTQIANCFNKKPPHKKVTPLIAETVWRLESIKSKLTGKDPMITKETARTAQAKVYFDNSKFLQQFPQFHYTLIQETVQRVCAELKQLNNL